MKNPHQSWGQSGRTPLTLSPRKRKDPVCLPLGVGSHSYLIRGQNCRRSRNSLRLRIITAGPRTACKRSGMSELSWDVSSATSDRKKWATSVIRGTILCAALLVTHISYVTGWEHTQITGQNNASTHNFLVPWIPVVIWWMMEFRQQIALNMYFSLHPRWVWDGRPLNLTTWALWSGNRSQILELCFFTLGFHHFDSTKTLMCKFCLCCLITACRMFVCPWAVCVGVYMTPCFMNRVQIAVLLHVLKSIRGTNPMVLL